VYIPPVREPQTAAGNAQERAQELVRRPDPGTLARGAWEAPSWAFYAGAAVVVVAAALYAAMRLGVWGRWKRRALLQKKR